MSDPVHFYVKCLQHHASPGEVLWCLELVQERARCYCGEESQEGAGAREGVTGPAPEDGSNFWILETGVWGIGVW